MARKSKTAAAPVAAFPTVEQRMAEIRAAIAQEEEARIRRQAERDIAVLKNRAAAAIVQAIDQRDIQRIMSGLLDGAKWQAARGDYWAAGAIDLRGKDALVLDFGGATVDFGGTAEQPFLLDDAPNVRIANFNAAGIYVPPAAVAVAVAVDVDDEDELGAAHEPVEDDAA